MFDLIVISVVLFHGYLDSFFDVIHVSVKMGDVLHVSDGLWDVEGLLFVDCLVDLFVYGGCGEGVAGAEVGGVGGDRVCRIADLSRGERTILYLFVIATITGIVLSRIESILVSRVDVLCSLVLDGTWSVLR